MAQPEYENEHYNLICHCLFIIIFISMSIVKKILSPAFFGCGVGLFLYVNMDKLPMPAYLVNIPFYILAVFPSGLLWKNVSKS